MSSGAPPPSSPDPFSPRFAAAPSDLVAMPPSPPRSPPAAAEDEVRPWPPMKMKLFPYAVHCVCQGMGRSGEILLLTFLVIHYLYFIVSILPMFTDGGQARFWAFVSDVMGYLCLGFTTFITIVFIRDYMRVDGVYHVDIYPPPRQQQQPAAEAAAAPTSTSGDGHVLGLIPVCGMCFLAGPRLCDKRINGKDQSAEKILLSLAPPAEAKIRVQMVANISDSTSLGGPR